MVPWRYLAQVIVFLVIKNVPYYCATIICMHSSGGFSGNTLLIFHIGRSMVEYLRDCCWRAFSSPSGIDTFQRRICRWTQSSWVLPAISSVSTLTVSALSIFTEKASSNPSPSTRQKSVTGSVIVGRALRWCEDMREVGTVLSYLLYMIATVVSVGKRVCVLCVCVCVLNLATLNLTII